LGPIDPPGEPNLFSLSITLPDAGQDLFVGNDTLAVVGFKMLVDTISVRKVGASDEKFEPRLLLASYLFGFADYNVIGGGLVGAGTFNGLRYSVLPSTPLNADFDDPDLIERDQTGRVINRYSISITGVYNRNLFRFRSKVSRAVQYDFLGSVRLPEFNSFLEARLRGNWKQWFLNTLGTAILNPNNQSNAAQIEENILKYFDILTFTVGEIPLQ
ncbi:MAG: hypothetical protein ACRDGA_11410, partial [Bacteroidota bacterium]